MTTGPEGPGDRPRVLAFYLPQFHPIPENDEWWEPGFTEWSNVVRARPLFPGHYQPHLAAELGYYDLRVPEVREHQADLARQYGLSGFVYYHYWFHGRRLLERPFDEVLKSGRPDFPFALCWANEEWTRNWDAQSGTVLVEQRFSEADDLAHIRWLVGAFADRRYLTIDGRPLMLVYRADLLPDPRRTTDLWREETRAAGFPDVYLAMVESRHKNVDPRPLGFDATVGFRSDAFDRLDAPVDAYREHTVLDYEAAIDAALHRPAMPWRRFPGVMAGWDNTPRRPTGAVIFPGGTPESYERWLRRTVESVAGVRQEENLIFVAAWNEWAEGNHLEPDRRYGRAYLEATHRALFGTDGDDNLAVTPPEGSAPTDPRVPLDLDSAAGHAFTLARAQLHPGAPVVQIGEGSPGVASAFEGAGLAYRAIALEPGADSLGALVGKLDGSGDPGALVMEGVLEHWPDPHRLLGSLSEWAGRHGKPPLVVTVANVAHFDVGLALLTGQWEPPGGDPVEGSHCYTRNRLHRLFERSGWRLVATDDFEAIRSAHHADALVGAIPEAMAGALRVLARSSNPSWATERFVWALVPVAVGDPPGPMTGTAGIDRPDDPGRAVSEYFSSIGMVSGQAEVQREDRLRRARSQAARKRIQRALVSLALPDRWSEELPLLADTVDELAELYLARTDLVTIFGADESFDAVRYVQWAVADQPMAGAAVERLGDQLRRETTDAIRDALSSATEDRRWIDEAADVLARLYLGRWDLRSVMDHGTGVEVGQLLAWVVSAQDTGDSDAARLGPYRALIQSALDSA